MQNSSHISIGLMDTDRSGLPDNWEYQLARAYSILDPDGAEFGWKETLHPRDKYGKWRDVIARLVRRNDEQRATIDKPAGDTRATGVGGEVPRPGTRQGARRGDSAHPRGGPVVNGRKLKLGKSGALPKHGREEAIRKDGGSTPQLYEVDAETEAATFREMISKIKETKNGAAVEVYDEEDYKKMRLFMDETGKAGFGIKGGDELVSVYNLPGGPKGIGRHMTAAAINQGARRADAFDTVLPKIYGKEGLKTVARMPFSREYAPDGWDYEHFKDFNNGEPDVAFMGYDPEQVGKPYEPGSGETVDDYDVGIEKAREAARRARRR